MMIKKYFIFLFLFSLLGVGGLFAQQKDKVLPKANEEFAEKKFVEAEANYRISQSKFPNRTVAPYNLGNAIYKQNQNAEAQYAYVEALRKAKVKSQKHKILHNLGNTFMKDKNLFHQKRERQSKIRIKEIVEHKLKDELWGETGENSLNSSLQKVVLGNLSPYQIAEEIIQEFKNRI